MGLLDHRRRLVKPPEAPPGYFPDWAGQLDDWLRKAERRGSADGLSDYLADVERFSDAQWARARALVAVLKTDGLGFWERAQLRLVRADDRPSLAALEWQRQRQPDDVRTHVDRGAVWADLPGVSVRLAEVETPLWVSVRSVEGERAVLFTGIRYVDQAQHEPEVEVGEALVVRRLRDPLANAVARQRHQDHSAGAVEVTVPPGTAELTVTVRIAGLERSAKVALRADPPLRESPLSAEERSPYSQEQLVAAYLESTAPLAPDLVYLQAFGGTAPTDSPAAICAELRRTHPHLRTVWGVQDPQTPVPEGSERVLVRSSEWHAVLATAGHLVVGADLPLWFRRRPGQRVLQTNHGYPSKSMGRSLWRTKNFTPARVEALLARTRDAWTAVLSPCPEMDRWYREEYAFTGEVISLGLPRTDALVRPGDRRDEVRDSLGIGPGQTVVLYAPTWRDDQGEQLRAVRTRGLLDLDALAAALGPAYVVLDRGHRFQRRRPDRDLALDVTSYPEVNDLILAADVAVLDYSSIRFDVALAGKPMVFFVPDLVTYSGSGRGFLYPFEESAPGPLLTTVEQVVATLRDPSGLGDGLPAFNQRFNSLHDGQAASRVVQAFFGPRNGLG